MDTVQLVLLALLVGAVILDQLYRFRVLQAPPPVYRDDEPRHHKSKKKHHRNGDAPYDNGDRQSHHDTRQREPGNGHQNGNRSRRGFDRPFP